MTMTDELRPLATGPGKSLATEIHDFPAQERDLLLGALERLSTLDLMLEDLEASQIDLARDAYLRGLAAAAIVADAAHGTREFTSARDFAVGGREVTFLPEGVTIGMLTLGASGMACADLALSVLYAPQPVPPEQTALAHGLRAKLAGAARARLSQGRESGRG